MTDRPILGLDTEDVETKAIVLKRCRRLKTKLLSGPKPQRHRHCHPHTTKTPAHGYGFDIHTPDTRQPSRSPRAILSKPSSPKENQWNSSNAGPSTEEGTVCS